ncbi:hypothetical protein K1720_08390 [Thermococcus argininiproducens]|uniref:Uncharacterized protein n=1 Tax=Thermococcus argininiproducens TaxID=2866384 RepID=A0A9E7M9N9_9EURY|nr:hypothetical protein [Thermococcus argininiproducens]USG99522.1 hypothetical protein K1720_08390 [Thermococcus argininiproducens]
MVSLRELTWEYIEGLRYVKEIPREVVLPIGMDIKAIIGPRRVGKTFLMLKKPKIYYNMGKMCCI